MTGKDKLELAEKNGFKCPQGFRDEIIKALDKLPDFVDQDVIVKLKAKYKPNHETR